MGVRSCLDPFPSSVWAGRQGASAVWEGRVIQNCFQGLAPDLLKKCSDCQSGPLGHETIWSKPHSAQKRGCTEAQRRLITNSNCLPF